MSALMGVRDETQALLRARLDEAIRRLDLVRREELEAVQELAANARAGQEGAEAELVSVRTRPRRPGGPRQRAREHAGRSRTTLRQCSGRALPCALAVHHHAPVGF